MCVPYETLEKHQLSHSVEKHCEDLVAKRVFLIK